MESNRCADFGDTAMTDSRAVHMLTRAFSLLSSAVVSKEQSTPPYPVRHWQAAVQNGLVIRHCFKMLPDASVKWQSPFPEQIVYRELD